jgi:hypothetical protein
LDTPAIPAQGTAFVTKDQGGNKKGKGKTKYVKDTEWNVLSPEAQSKIIEACKKGKDDGEDKKSVVSTKTIKSLSKTMTSLEKDNWQQKKLVSTAMRMKNLCYPQRKVQAISKMLWRCLRDIILRLPWP